MRPIGVTIIAYLHWLRGLAYALGGAALLGFIHLNWRLVSAITHDTFLERITSAAGKAMGYGLLIFALFWIILGFGMWATKNWAHSLTLLCAVIWVVFEVVKVASIPTPWRIFRLAVDAMIFLYLLLPGVKRAFK
jgi:uncharacterized membrane protein (DUF2068 family)